MSHVAVEVVLSGLPGEAEVPPGASRDETAALVRAARGGDHEAFSRLYVRYHRLVHGVLLTRVKRSDAEDLAQEVFLAAWRQLPALRREAGFGAWLSTIARNRAVDHLRGSAATEGLAEDLPAAERADGSGLHVLEAIRRLPEAYREPLVLRLVEGMTGPQIARQTGLTEGSVRVNLHRGFALLRAALGGSR